MCGIAGYISSEAADHDLIHRMCDVIFHRGPDEGSYYVEGNVALGVRRLAIIDLLSGSQPLFNEDGTLAIVFNGEIYNFRELRANLEDRGHHFRTNTDAECIVHLYEDLGGDCVRHLRGMFAFALWDDRARRLFLARDRVGKKPLFYRVWPGGIAFASELKSLLEDPTFKREVDPVALHHFLTYQYVPSPWSIYKGVNKLPPAHTLTFDFSGTRLQRYWKLSYSEKLPITEEEAAEELMSLSREATRIRLISDRPLGVFLSGGLDSSMVVAAMADQMSEPVKTFTIGFEEKAFDERRYARLIATHFGTEHHEMVVRSALLDVLPKLVWHYDEPFADSSAVPSYYLAEMARREVVVALNGDGGDESFGGYKRYVAQKLAEHIRLPTSMQAVARGLVGLVPARSPGSLPRRAKDFLDVAFGPPADRYAKWICCFTNEQKEAIYSTDMRKEVEGIDSYELLSEQFVASDGPDVVDKTLNVDVLTYLPGDLLVKMDVATMANSLEARSPFLDQKLMEFAAKLPSRMKIRGLTGKYLVRKAAEGILPRVIVTREKRGFGVPIADWIRGELRDLAHDVLTDATSRGRDYFNPDAVRRLLAEHERGVDRSPHLWALIQFELWHRMFVDRRGV